MENVTGICQLADKSNMYKYFMLLPILQILVNGIPLLATTLNQQKLTGVSSIYIHVKNILVANIFFSLFVLYTSINLAFHIEIVHFDSGNNDNKRNRYDKNNDVHKSIMYWWAFRKSFTLCLAFTMATSVVGLIYSLKRKMFLNNLPTKMSFSLGRIGEIRSIFGSVGNVNQAAKNNRQISKSSSKFSKGMIDYLIITMIWVFAIGYSLISTFWWNCLEHCNCLPLTDDKYNCMQDAKCSGVWYPVSNLFLGGIVLLWLFNIVLILFVLVASWRSYQRNVNFSRNIPQLMENDPMPFQRHQSIVPRDLTLNFAFLRTRKTILRKQRKSDNRFDEAKMRRKTLKKKKTVSEINANNLPMDTMNQTGVPKIRNPENRNSVVQTRQNSSNLPTPLPVRSPRLSPSLKLVIFLSCLVLLCNLPFTVIFVCDVFVDQWKAQDVVILLSVVALNVYVISCPLLMLKYLSKLKTATIKLLLVCDCTRTTTVKGTTPQR